MPYLAAAIILIGAICLVNLVLSLGVVRRLRSHTTLIEHLLTRNTAPKPILSAGERIGPFSAVTTGGGLISRESMTGSAGNVLVGFFSPDCDSCRDRLPEFIRKAKESDETLAVVVGQEAAAMDLVDSFTLHDVSRVVLEAPEDGAMSHAFGVQALPAVCVVDGTGLVLSSDADEHQHAAAGAN